MYRTINLIIICCMVLLGLNGAGAMAAASQEIVKSDADRSSQVSLAPGQVLVIRLPSSPGTGYTWVVPGGPIGLLEPVGEPKYEYAGETKLGGCEEQVFRFKAVRNGQMTLRLKYMRPWEKDKPPEKIYEINLIVE
jgi:inhibitor of cysteine peptidase